MTRAFPWVALLIGALGPGCDCTSEIGVGGMCTTGSDCPSGICRDGRCAPRPMPGTDGGPGSGIDGGPGGFSPCGGDPSCIDDGIGPGTATPFDVDGEPDESDGVGLTPEGWIRLDSTNINTNIIWIANTQESTVSKVDTRTFVELARYATGPRGALGASFDFFEAEDPSRTSVNTESDVYVGNRQGRSLVKISALGAECPDTNGDGAITTSSGATDVLPWGMDDCVLWRTELPDGGIIRSVAAQDVDGLDGTLVPYVWVGGWDGVAYKLDGNTGEVLITTPSPANPYGFALDGAGNLWISGRNGPSLGRIDTNRCVDTASCDVMVCGDDGDDCIKQGINAPGNTYGITVDFRQRVWLGGDDRVMRYDPAAPMGARWSTNDPGQFIHGITADGLGYVWGAGQGRGIYQLDADDPSMGAFFPGTDGYSAKGMAVDFDGKIWAINVGDGNATVVEPMEGGLGLGTVMTDVSPGHGSPYTYSDMTGSQLRLATNRRGYYRRIFEGCPDDGSSDGTEWRELHFDVDAPPGTRVNFRVRTAADRASLPLATWIGVASIPPDASPIDLLTALMAAGVTVGNVLEVEVALIAERDSSTEVITPTVRRFDVTHSCAPIFG